MQKEPTVKSLAVRNLLSFGDELEPIELQNLNVLIGPNGSGKSNLIEVIALLQGAPGGLATVINNGGPIEDWLWKGGSEASPTASIEAVVNRGTGEAALRYRLAFARVDYRFLITDELVAKEFPLSDDERPYFRRGPMGLMGSGGPDRQSAILAQRKGPDYPEITYLGKLFSKFFLYRSWEFGTLAGIREPCDAGLQNSFLEEDGSNLGVMLDRLLSLPRVKHELIESLRTFLDGTKDLRTSIVGSKVQTRLEESGLAATIPLNRVSDGTVRWLALLAILLNPDPPPLVCIEEPELGLHPDMVHEIGKLLIAASERMQLIVTTHSDALIEEFTEMPDAVVVCEKEAGASRFRRLDASQLSAWLKDYSLGQLWRKGQIGGNRW
ncbi:MAG: AAA family ATPase [Bryobacteraceae bacterium]|jgi:predicted ATPase